MPELIPAILVQDANMFRERLALMEGSARTVQLDCMDGVFVRNTSWYESGSPETTLEIELHLMVSDPAAVIESWKRVPQVVRAIWHVEIETNHDELIALCTELGWECGLALSPETPVEWMAPFADRIDEVLVLGVNPGWSGQALIPSTLEKVRALKHLFPHLIIGFDGGVTENSLEKIVQAGADRVCVASMIFEAKDPKAAFQSLCAKL